MVAIYADGADLETIRKLAQDPRIDGFTTNPSLMKKAGIGDYRSFAQAVLDAAGGKPVSFEVLADDLEGMESQGLEIASWGNVFVKVPITNTSGQFTGEVLTSLCTNGVKVNVTAVMTLDQVRWALRCLTQGNIISIFAGRIADTGVDPQRIVRAAGEMVKGYVSILWASARQAFDVALAEQSGANIITLTPDLIARLALRGKNLEQYSLETVQQFKRDAEGITL